MVAGRILDWVFITLGLLVLACGLFTFVDEALHSRNARAERAARGAKRVAASIYSQEASTGTRVNSITELVEPACKGLQVCFKDTVEALEYARGNELMFVDVDGGRNVCQRSACSPIGPRR